MEILSNKDAMRYSTETFLLFEAKEVMDLAKQLGKMDYEITNPTLPPWLAALKTYYMLMQHYGIAVVRENKIAIFI